MLGSHGVLMLRVEPRKVLIRDRDMVVGTHRVNNGFPSRLDTRTAPTGSLRRCRVRASSRLPVSGG
jgi:hypothetical protein